MVPYTITAYDDGGPFTVTLERGRILGATIAGEPVPSRLIRQEGERVHIGPVSGQGALNLMLTAQGGLSWSSRRASTPLP